MSSAVSREERIHLPGEEVQWSRRFGYVLLAVLAVRLVYAAVFPLDLAPDESYYWDWGRRLDYGYFSKPPMIGWLMGLAGWMGGNSVFGLKAFPVLLATAGLGFVFLAGRDMYGARAGFWAAMVLLATPANAALNTFFTIDAPLFLFWSASLWLAWRWWSGPREEAWRWAIPLMLSLGLGYLTKQIQLVFPVLWLVLVALGHRERGRPAWFPVLVVVVGSLLFLAPPIYWNWQHDWITFRHTADELDRSPLRWARSVKFVGEFVGGQAGLGGGVLWGLMMIAATQAALRWRRLDDRGRFLLVLFVPGFLAYAGLSVSQRVEQNWPLVFYPAAAVLLAGTVAQAPAGSRWRRWFGVGIGLGSTLAVLLMLVPFVFPASPWAGRKSDPTARIRGWRDLALRAGELRSGVPRPEQTFFLAPRDRYVASALAFYLPDHPRTYCWEDPGHPESQYGIWGWPVERAGWDALVIEFNAETPRIQEISRYFQSLEPRGEIVIRVGPGGERDRKYAVFLGRDFRPPAR